MTGNAAAKWRHSGLEIDSESQVLRTANMVNLDWQRTVTHAGVTDCLRQKFATGLPSGQKLVSFGPIAFPKVAKLTAAFRGLIDVGSGKSAVRVLVDVVVVRGIVLVHSSPVRLTVVFISVPTWFGKVPPRMW